MKKNKLLVGMDNDLWIEFVAKCQKDGIKVADRLKDYIKQDLGK